MEANPIAPRVYFVSNDFYGLCEGYAVVRANAPSCATVAAFAVLFKCKMMFRTLMTGDLLYPYFKMPFGTFRRTGFDGRVTMSE